MGIDLLQHDRIFGNRCCLSAACVDMYLYFEMWAVEPLSRLTILFTQEMVNLILISVIP